MAKMRFGAFVAPFHAHAKVGSELTDRQIEGALKFVAEHTAPGGT